MMSPRASTASPFEPKSAFNTTAVAPATTCMSRDGGGREAEPNCET